MKRIISLFLSLLLALSTLTAVDLSAFAVQKNDTNIETSISSSSEDGVTDLFADVINDAQQSKEADINSVSRITFSESTATVTLKTSVDSTLIVAVYSEDEIQLLGTGTAYITEKTTKVNVVVDIDDMPQYFVAKGYIVDTLSMKPISEVYNCEYYTRDMQNLFESTVDTYDKTRIINFDESENNNFAVYKDDVIIETQSESSNVLESDSEGTYIIGYPSERIKNLVKGDILSLEEDGKNLIVVKVAEIIIKDNSVVIIEDENIELDEVFDYVKISNSDDLYDVEDQPQNGSKKAQYRANSKDELIGNNKNQQTDSTSEYTGSAKITGSLKVSLTAGVDIFVTLKRQSIDLYVDYGLFFNFNITVKGSAVFQFNTFSFYILPGLSIDVEPKITINFEVVMNLDISYTGRVGFKLDAKEGFTNLSCSPTLNGQLDLTGKISVSFGMKISLTALYGVISGYVNPSITLTITAKLDNASNHLCAVCYAGNLKYSANLGYGIEFLKGKKSFSNTVNIGSGSICDFYYSVTNSNFDKGICPNKNNNKTRELHCVTSSGAPAKFATVDLYKKACACDTTNVLNKFRHRLASLNHYTLYKSYRADSNGIIKFTLDAPEEGYDYSVKASYLGYSNTYYFPWGGGPVYPIEINTNPESSSSLNNYSLNSVALEEDDYYSIKKSESADGVRKIEYSNLTPNETYNFYSLRDLDYLCSLVSSNILYVHQYIADENGKLTISFKPSENTETYEDCLLAMGRDNIGVADVNQCDVVCKDDENEIHPLVKVYGRILQEGVDYVLEGEIKETTAGVHLFSVVGIGDYYGKIECQYNLMLYKGYYENACENAQSCMLKEYYSKETVNALKYTVDNSKSIVSSTIDQIDIDKATNDILDKISSLEYVDDFEKDFGSLTWKWNKEEQSFTIYGAGYIESIPWEQYKDIVKKVEITENITGIAADSFNDCPKLEEIIVLNPQCNIQEGAFSASSTIVGYSQSTAEKYAQDNEIPFNSLSPDLSNLLIKTVSLSLESSITMNFKVLKSAVADFENPYVVFNCEDDKLTVTDYTEQGDYYVFSYPGISPQLMNDNVVAVLHAEHNGIDYTSPEKVMSVRTYAYTMLERYNTDDYAELRTLLVDLLNYGAASQKYVGYQTDNLVNADLTNEQKAWGTDTEPLFTNIRDYDYKTIDNPTSKWISSGLVLNNSVTVRAKFSADSIENKTVVITCGKGAFTYTKDDFVKDKDGNYYVYCNEIFANEMSEEILLTVYDNGVQCSNTMRFSIESYAKLVHDSYKGTTLDELTTAMMRYGNSAKAYGA